MILTCVLSISVRCEIVSDHVVYSFQGSVAEARQFAHDHELQYVSQVTDCKYFKCQVHYLELKLKDLLKYRLKSDLFI